MSARTLILPQRTPWKGIPAREPSAAKAKATESLMF